MGDSAFPSWAIGIIILFFIVSVSVAAYFLFRRRITKAKAAEGAQDEEMILEKNVQATPSSFTYPTNPLYNETSSTLKSSQPSQNYQQNSSKLIEEDKPFEPIKINLPLPPPSTSLFSDKVELDSIEANDLYLAYMAASQSETIDDKPFLSNAAANIQQKAATIRSTLKQSLRRKPTNKNSVVPVNQLFEISTSPTSKSPSTKSPVEMSRQSSTTSSRFPRASLQTSNLLPPSPVPDSPSTLESFSGRYSNNSSKKSLIRYTQQQQQQQEDDSTSTKIMIDTIPNESYFSLPMSPITPSSPQKHKPSSTGVDYVDEINQYTHALDIEESEEEQLEKKTQPADDDEDSPQEAASAARKLIRTASRKSRSRSITRREEKQEIPAYVTVRGKPPIEKIDTSTNDSKKWSTETSSPSPKRTLMSSTLSGSATVSGKRAQFELQKVLQSRDSATIGRRTIKEPTLLKDLFNNKQEEAVKPSSSGNVDTIRRMLQSSWSGSNIKESASSHSLASDGVVSPVGSINPRLQNQHLVSLSLKGSANRNNRPSIPFNTEEEGPYPTVSFSSSTVRTMIPAEEDEQQTPRLLKNKKPRQLKPSKLGVSKTPAQKEREKYLKSLEI